MAQRQPSSAYIWISFAVISSLIALVLSFTSADYARVTSAKEAEMIEVQLGKDTLAMVNRIAGDWYTEAEAKLAVPTDWSAEMARDHSVKLLGFESEGFWRWLEQRTEAFLDLGYWFLRRIALFVVWIPLWIPMLILAALHGYWDREIKKTDFGYTSPVLNHWARSIMHFLTMMTLLLFVVPVALDPIIFPVFLMGVTVMAGIATGNVQKRI